MLPLGKRAHREDTSNEIHNFTTFSLKEFNVRLKATLVASHRFEDLEDTVKQHTDSRSSSHNRSDLHSLRSTPKKNIKREGERNFEGIILSILFLSNLIAFLSFYR